MGAQQLEFHGVNWPPVSLVFTVRVVGVPVIRLKLVDDIDLLVNFVCYHPTGRFEASGDKICFDLFPFW